MNLPPGWTVGKDKGDGHVRIITPDGVGVPIVDDPLVGDDQHRAALRELQKWQGKKPWTTPVVGDEPIFPPELDANEMRLRELHLEMAMGDPHYIH
jgi:hypothetical protein